MLTNMQKCSPTEEDIHALFKEHGNFKAVQKIKIIVSHIKLGRMHPELKPLERLTIANTWKYFVHKLYDIKI